MNELYDVFTNLGHQDFVHVCTMTGGINLFRKCPVMKEIGHGLRKGTYNR